LGWIFTVLGTGGINYHSWGIFWIGLSLTKALCLYGRSVWVQGAKRNTGISYDNNDGGIQEDMNMVAML
jgi:hypothetical protein